MLTQKIPLDDSPAAVDKPGVLVVDDEYGPRESIAFSLAGEFAVDTAERGRQALAKLKEKPYSVVVLDIRMPEMDGIRTLEEMRRIDPLVGVIMLTGYGTLLTAQQAMLGGANQYLRKPPDIPELIASVRRQAAAARERRAQARTVVEAQKLNAALKREIQEHEPQIWQARASVELVHDLNNPLTVVIGYSSLMAEEARRLVQQGADGARKLGEYSTMVEKAAEYCHHLSENWRLASRKVPEFAPVDLMKVALEVWQVIFFSNPAIRFSGLNEAMVRGSKFELMRVMQNLLTNSLEAGATRVELDLAPEDGKIALTVTDNGAGMNAESVKKAARGGFSSKATGTGLGLNICRHLAGTHGATFALESHTGRGTRVKLVFPPLPPG